MDLNEIGDVVKTWINSVKQAGIIDFGVGQDLKLCYRFNSKICGLAVPLWTIGKSLTKLH